MFSLFKKKCKQGWFLWNDACHSKRKFLVLFEGWLPWKDNCHFVIGKMKMMLSLKGTLSCCPVLRRELLFEEKNLVKAKLASRKKSEGAIMGPAFLPFAFYKVFDQILIVYQF